MPSRRSAHAAAPDDLGWVGEEFDQGSQRIRPTEPAQAGRRRRADERIGVAQQRDDGLFESQPIRVRNVPEVLQIVERVNDGIGPRQPCRSVVAVAPTLAWGLGSGIRLGQGHDGVSRLAHRRTEVLVGRGLDPAAEVLLLRQQVA